MKLYFRLFMSLGLLTGLVDAGLAQTLRLSESAQREQAEHLKAMGVTAWHEAGVLGRGVKIAILDSGFRGYRDYQGTVLPRKLTVASFRNDGNLEARDSQHGILCGEVIHAIAPEAQLLLANWEPDQPQKFLEAVKWAVESGASVISCSVIMPSWSDGEGNGPVHAELRKILRVGKPNEVLMFASAGNTARRHWSGTIAAGADGLHRWRGNIADNELTPFGDERVSVELCWSDVRASFQVQIVDRVTGREVGERTLRTSTAGGCCVVRLKPQAKHNYAVRVKQTRGPLAAFHIVALGANFAEYSPRGSIAFPADGAAVLAVGAVDQFGERQWYSSCGPNSEHPKPDLVAVVPFASRWRDRPFAGTSAAAPQAAALAVLCFSKWRSATATEVREFLRKHARDLGPPGHDPETGFGIARVPNGSEIVPVKGP